MFNVPIWYVFVNWQSSTKVVKTEVLNFFKCVLSIWRQKNILLLLKNKKFQHLKDDALICLFFYLVFFAVVGVEKIIKKKNDYFVLNFFALVLRFAKSMRKFSFLYEFALVFFLIIYLLYALLCCIWRLSPAYIEFWKWW